MPSYIVAFTYTDFFPSWGRVHSKPVWGSVNTRLYPLPVCLYGDAGSNGGGFGVCLRGWHHNGLGALKRLWFLILPLSRPTLTIAAALVTMEVLNDYGTVNHLAVPTFTYGIFDIWFYRQLHWRGCPAGVDANGVCVVDALSRTGLPVGGRMYHQATNRYRPLVRVPLKATATWLPLAFVRFRVWWGF